MTDVPCFRSLWALMALTALHLWPPLLHPWVQELCLSSALGSQLWFGQSCWAWQLSCGSLWLWLPHCGLALQTVFSAWSWTYCHGQDSSWPWLLSPELILMWFLNSTLSPRTSLLWILGWGWCCLGPALLSLLRQDKGSAWWGHSPIFLVEQPAQLFQRLGSWASFHLALLLHNSFFLHSRDIEKVIN